MNIRTTSALWMSALSILTRRSVFCCKRIPEPCPCGMSLRPSCRLPYSEWRLEVFQQLFGVDSYQPSSLRERRARSRTQLRRIPCRNYRHGTACGQKLASRPLANDDTTEIVHLDAQHGYIYDLELEHEDTRVFHRESGEEPAEPSLERGGQTINREYENTMSTVDDDLTESPTGSIWKINFKRPANLATNADQSDQKNSSGDQNPIITHEISPHTKSLRHQGPDATQILRANQAKSWQNAQALRHPKSVTRKPRLARSQDVSTTSQSPLSDDMLISPLERHIDRVRNKTTKPWPREIQSPEPLQSNPWARMLAEPIRNCIASRVRTTRALLDDLSFVENPKDGEVYLLPQRLADLAAFKENAASDRYNSMSSPCEIRGTVVRILPDHLLYSQLTRKMTVYDNQTETRETKKGAVAGRLLSINWIQDYHKRQAYDMASKEYWAALEAQGGPKNEYDQRQELFDYSKLSWVDGLEDKLVTIMRQRVLIALSAIGEIESRPERAKYQPILRVPRRRKGWRLEAVGPELTQITVQQEAATNETDATEDFWNDMGDIEASDAITGTGQKQGNRKDDRPPIAVRPDEIKTLPTADEYSNTSTLARNSTTTKPHEIVADELPRESFNSDDLAAPDAVQATPTDQRLYSLFYEQHFDDPSRWLPGAIILDLADPTTSPHRHLYRSASDDTTNTPTSATHYLPPTIRITINTNPDVHHRIPIFPLQPMLQSPHLLTILDSICHAHDALRLPAPNHRLLLFKASAQKSHLLALELWRLWRYLGGLKCLSTALPGARMSDAQMRQLHELCGVPKSVVRTFLWTKSSDESGETTRLNEEAKQR